MMAAAWPAAQTAEYPISFRPARAWQNGFKKYYPEKNKMLNINLLRRVETLRNAANPRNANLLNTADPTTLGSGKKLNLSRVKPGQQVTITGFERLSATHRQHLQAYGMLPGRSITVLAQNPVTIVLIEQTELAFETEIARQVTVE
jgi:Fe2+ transport system protein FeoA